MERPQNFKSKTVAIEEQFSKATSDLDSLIQKCDDEYAKNNVISTASLEKLTQCYNTTLDKIERIYHDRVSANPEHKEIYYAAYINRLNRVRDDYGFLKHIYFNLPIVINLLASLNNSLDNPEKISISGYPQAILDIERRIEAISNFYQNMKIKPDDPDNNLIIQSIQDCDSLRRDLSAKFIPLTFYFLQNIPSIDPQDEKISRATTEWKDNFVIWQNACAAGDLGLEAKMDELLARNFTDILNAIDKNQCKTEREIELLSFLQKQINYYTIMSALVTLQSNLTCNHPAEKNMRKYIEILEDNEYNTLFYSSKPNHRLKSIYQELSKEMTSRFQPPSEEIQKVISAIEDHIKQLESKTQYSIVDPSMRGGVDGRKGQPGSHRAKGLG